MSRVPNYHTPQPSNPVDFLIPSRNVPALLSYYLGLFSILPCLGAIMGPVAIFFGIKGLILANRHPEVHGQAHAITGIVCGSLFGLIWILSGIFILIGVILAK